MQIVRTLIYLTLLALLVPAQGGAVCVDPCSANAPFPASKVTDKPSQTSGSYDQPDGTHAVIPQFKGAMKGALPKLYQPRHPKHPTFAAPLTSSVHP
jgi:hypothetical protein